MLSSETHDVRATLTRIEQQSEGQSCFASDWVSSLELTNLITRPRMETGRPALQVRDLLCWISIHKPDGHSVNEDLAERFQNCVGGFKAICTRVSYVTDVPHFHQPYGLITVLAA